jgi:hypothetical protein
VILFILIFRPLAFFMKFIWQFFLSSSLILALLQGLIISIDPYDKLGINVWNFKTKAVAQSRENKFIMLENTKTKYEAFVLGSSAAHRFPTKKIKELTGLEAFNYSAQHTNPEDYLAILRHIMDRHHPKLILLQVDFIELNENYATSNQLYNSPLVKYLRSQKKTPSLFDNNYFTLAALSDSLRVIYVNLWGKALHSNYLEHGDYKAEPLVPGKVSLEQSDYQDYKLSQLRLKYLQEIKELCDVTGIKLVAFSAPLSYEHTLIARAHPLHQEFLAAMVKIFGEFYNFQHESIKDFSTYRQFHSSAHITHEFSATILERLFTGLPNQLGEILRSP